MKSAACEARYGRAVSERTIRRVWAAISCHPQQTIRALARQIGYRSTADVVVALRVLRDAGYIDFKDGAKRARTVVVPFIVTARNRNGHR